MSWDEKNSQNIHAFKMLICLVNEHYMACRDKNELSYLWKHLMVILTSGMNQCRAGLCPLQWEHQSCEGELTDDPLKQLHAITKQDDSDSAWRLDTHFVWQTRRHRLVNDVILSRWRVAAVSVDESESKNSLCDDVTTGWS